MNTQTLFVTTRPVISVDLLAASYRSDSFPADWSKEQRVRSLQRYEQWLKLKQANPRARMAPTRDIDEFWHLHMLSPVAYHRDCMQLIGRLIDHDGGFGKGEGELPQLKAVFLDTARLWERAYGTPYRDDGVFHDADEATNCWHDCADRCWHACNNSN